MKAIIFDCFGVLTTDYWRVFVATLPLAQQTAASDLNKAYDAGYISTTDFMDQVEALTGNRPDLVEHTRAPATKNDELLRYISQLKPQYKIGLLSNIASNWVTDKFLTANEQALFDEMIFSHNVHLVKPDHAIFELMAERLGVAPTDCVMIDVLEVNCTAAKETGMQDIVYQNFAQCRPALEQLLS